MFSRYFHNFFGKKKIAKKSIINEIRCQIIGLLKDKTKSNRNIAKLVEEDKNHIKKLKYMGPQRIQLDLRNQESSL